MLMMSNNKKLIILNYFYVEFMINASCRGKMLSYVEMFGSEEPLMWPCIGDNYVEF